MKRLLIVAGLLVGWWIEWYLETHYGNTDGDMIDAEYWRYGEIYNDNEGGKHGSTLPANQIALEVKNTLVQ